MFVVVFRFFLFFFLLIAIVRSEFHAVINQLYDTFYYFNVAVDLIVWVYVLCGYVFVGVYLWVCICECMCGVGMYLWVYVLCGCVFVGVCVV